MAAAGGGGGLHRGAAPADEVERQVKGVEDGGVVVHSQVRVGFEVGFDQPLPSVPALSS